MKLLFLTLALIAGADFLESAVRLSGASCAEDLSQSEMERYESLAAHPLDLNGATRRELLASGLFSAYQVATILDYIAGNGEICSIAELGTVDGIGPERARDLAPFVLLEPAGRLGARPRKRLRADSMVRLADKSGTWSNAAKASASYGGFKAGLGAKDLSPTAGYLSWSGRRIVGQLTVGDFSARFWTGFTMTTLYTVGAFARSGTGISGSNTLSAGSAKRGMAADFQLGPVDLWAYATLDGEQMVHVQHISRRATVGATVLHDLAGFACSADWRFTLGKFTAFGESAINIVIPDSDRVSPEVRATMDAVLDALCDDLNTPIAIAHLFDAVKLINGGKLSNDDKAALAKFFEEVVGGVLGLKDEEAGASGKAEKALEGVMQLVLENRKKAREEKNWAESDHIRDLLASYGITVKDTKDGATWTLE